MDDLDAAVQAVGKIDNLTGTSAGTSREAFHLSAHGAGVRGIYHRILEDRENYRPWGHYENLLERNDHKIKELVVNPGERLSLQKHQRRAEHWTVVSGEALVTVGEREIPLKPGQSVDIPKGAVHRIMNPGEIPLVIVEVQMGDYFGEDDIIRLEDDYDRCT